MWESSTKAFLGHEHSPHVFMIGMRRTGMAEWLGGYEGRNVWEFRKVMTCERLGRWKILGGYGGGKFLDVR
jgi:hypothetical protein